MNHWASIKLAEATIKVGSGATPKGGQESYQTAGVPLIRSMNVRFEGFDRDGLAFLSTGQARALDGVVVAPDDVLLNITGASIGRVTLAPADMAGARVNQHVCIIRPRPGLEPKFVGYFLHAPEMQQMIMSEQYGATRQALTKSMILDFDVPLPPLNEQRRIVAKLEALLARSRRAKEALDAIPALLERFRQSVLAAAFRGDLTRDWREANPDVEPASKLLERIRSERRRRWEEAELERMRAKGKAPKDDRWKERYEAPAQIDDSSLQELPRGWAWASLEEVCPLDAPVVYGIILPGDDVQGGVPYIRPIDMNSDGTIDFTSMKRTAPSIAAQYQRASLRGGDIVLSIVGTIGKVIVVPDELDGGNITQSSARLRPPEWLSGEYLRLALLSPALKNQYDKFRFGNAVQRLNIEHVRRVAIPIAPTEEMKRIVIRATAALARAEQVQTVEQRQRLDKLEQSILAKAFRGELVSQDPADEPASALIKRIRAQREVAEQQGRSTRPKRRRETKVA